MLIRINYPDDSFDYVKEKILDRLIESKKIKRFRRSAGWVTLGVDPVRTARREQVSKKNAAGI
ncbi:MAG: hypothetical protein GJV46_15475 [Geobacter sp.]|nr:hypothetical protein [Geobacter sp.]